MKHILYTIFFMLGLLPSVWAETWNQTNVQYLYGNNFDRLIGFEGVEDGKMQTITIEHAGDWTYGNNYFFIDMTSAQFTSTKEYKMYAEWAPKVSLSKLSNKELSFLFINDIYLAGELNQGDDFQAINLGMGVGLDVWGFNFFTASLFSRKDNFNDRTYQMTLAFNSTFNVLSIPFIFEGFLDYYGVDNGAELVTQPRFLLDGKVFSENTSNLHMGVEYYIYSSNVSKQEDIFEAVPQAMIKWIW